MDPDDLLLLACYLAAIAAAEARPSEADLAEAPDLDRWQVLLTLGGVPLLCGQVLGHPRLGDAVITTSPLIALNAGAGWARTFSRWYRLGVPFDTLARDLAPKEGTTDVTGFSVLGFIPIDDPDLLARLLAARIASIRRLAQERRGRGQPDFTLRFFPPQPRASPPDGFLMLKGKPMRIRFIDVLFPDPALKPRIERRLKGHFRRLMARRSAPDNTPEPAADEDLDEDTPDRFDIPWGQQNRILRRAERIVACANRMSPLTRLKAEDRRRLEVLRNGVDLVVINEHRADEIASELHADMPWMGPANEVVWRGLRRSAQSEEPAARFRPLLLVGPPGTGKSYWARRLGRLIGVPNLAIEATVENASFGLVGSQKGWGNAAPGRLINLILAELVANPVVFIDEIEKSGRASSTSGQSYTLTNALLPMLESTSASVWTCPYHEVGFDMSWISWVLAANDIRGLPAPLLSRCTVVRLDPPTVPDLQTFARREGARRGLSDASIDAICIALERAAARRLRPSLRSVIRMLEHSEWFAVKNGGFCPSLSTSSSSSR